MFSKIGVLKNSQISQKTSMLESLFNTAAGLLASNFIKKRLHHRRFLVNMAKYLRTSMIEGFFCENRLLGAIFAKKSHLHWVFLQEYLDFSEPQDYYQNRRFELQRILT